MKKGEQTKLHILNAGMKYASQYGLADITIGTMSSLCKMSRTGVISHFDNKEDMQLAILTHSEQLFMQHVILPAKSTDAISYLKNTLFYWRDWVSELFNDSLTSCPFIKAIVEYQNRPDCAVKKLALRQQNNLLAFLVRRIEQCKAQQRFKAEIDAKAMAYEIYSLYLGHSIARPTLDNAEANQHFEQAIKKLFLHALTKDKS